MQSSVLYNQKLGETQRLLVTGMESRKELIRSKPVPGVPGQVRGGVRQRERKNVMFDKIVSETETEEKVCLNLVEPGIA